MAIRLVPYFVGVVSILTLGLGDVWAQPERRMEQGETDWPKVYDLPPTEADMPYLCVNYLHDEVGIQTGDKPDEGRYLPPPGEGARCKRKKGTGAYFSRCTPLTEGAHSSKGGHT
jgi:hypothetical protein